MKLKKNQLKKDKKKSDSINLTCDSSHKNMITL
jgi:hypothetical protein